MEHPLSPTQALTRGFVLPAPQLLPAGAAPGGAAAAGTAMQSRQGFRIGALCLMVRYEYGSELTEMPAVHRLPNAPHWFCGIANLHGMLVPVIELSRYIGAAPGVQAKRMLLVLGHGTDAAGVVIDGLPERLRWSTSQLADAATAPPELADVVQHAVFIGEQLWFDLDLAALLHRLEQSLESLH